MNETEKKLDLILTTLVNFKEEFTSFKRDTSEKLDRIEATLLRMEDEQPKDTMATLKQMKTKLEQRDLDIKVLNKRVYKVEAELERVPDVRLL